MRILPFRATYPNMAYVTSPESFFAEVKEEYGSYRKSGFFIDSPTLSFFIYQIKNKERTFTGIISCVDIQDFYDGNIKKHENTLSAKEQKQMQLFLRHNALVKPVLLTYKPVASLNEWMHNYIHQHPHFYQVLLRDSKKEDHTFWKISAEEDLAFIQENFRKNIPQAYIADGHHRASTMALLHTKFSQQHLDKEFGQLFVAFFAEDELSIHDYNRVITHLDKMSSARFMALLSELFEITFLKNATKPTQKYEITMCFHHEWFLLKWKKSIIESQLAINNTLLDVDLLNNLVVRNILNITDVKTDARIQYVEGIKGLEGIVDITEQYEDSVAFCVFPVDINDLLSTADRGEIMPPKSTWFEPRMMNGLLVRELTK